MNRLLIGVFTEQWNCKNAEMVSDMMAVALAASSGGGDDDSRRKAEVFFHRARTVAAEKHYEYAIEMLIQGIRIVPERIDVYQELREVALQRKAAGGRKLVEAQALSLKDTTGDPRDMMFSAVQLLAYDPGNVEYMLAVAKAASNAGCTSVVDWITAILRAAHRGIGGADGLS